MLNIFKYDVLDHLFLVSFSGVLISVLLLTSSNYSSDFNLSLRIECAIFICSIVFFIASLFNDIWFSLRVSFCFASLFYLLEEASY